ncbi:MAG: hypothetical protein GX160_04220, partial [Clostridiales bacterium]|nr:hypothetical protein [Clostridiales bacterium]
MLLYINGVEVGYSQVSHLPVEFRINPYLKDGKWKGLTRAQHSFGLEPSRTTIVRIYYMVSGLGPNNCGPELIERYRLKEKDFHSSFKGTS